MSSLHILMDANNSRGVEYTARKLHFAASLSKALDDCSIPVLTDLPPVDRSRQAERVDYMHLPIVDADIRTRFQNGCRPAWRETTKQV
jgi:predicted glycosyltransferase